MPFSMPSYLLGIGTVVGALTLGFGGGVLLTKGAIKDSAGPTRVERVARSEPLPGASSTTPSVPQVTTAAAQAPRNDSSAVQPVSNEPVRQIQAVAEPARPAADTPRDEPAAPRDEPAKAAEAIKPEAAGQVEAIRQAEPRQAEQKDAEQWRSPRDQRRAEREQRRMEQRIEREQRYLERKARALEYVRTRQRPLEELERRARPELAFERDEPRSSPIASPLEGLFGRSIEVVPAERD